MRGGYDKHSKETIDDAVRRVIQNKESSVDVAEELGIKKRTLQRYVKEQRDKISKKREEFESTPIESSCRSVDEILKAKFTKFSRIKRHYETTAAHNIKIKLNGPIGIAHFGDPHLDDDGCDIGLFEKDMKLVQDTEGMFAGNIGDILNNWVGKLVIKYADQITTQSEGWKLFEWIFEQMPWLYVVYGNHDCWTGSNDPGKYILRAYGQQYVNHGTRMKLVFPNDEIINLNVAHDYKGHSEVNSVHGAMKKAMRFADDLYVCGHRHHTAMSMFMHPATNKPVWSIRLDSYKRYDDYPAKLGIDETFGSPCIVTILNPYTSNPLERVIPFLDPQAGADYLKWLRSKYV